MAKTDSRALHAYWTLLLPVQQPLQPRPLVPHLITVLVHDPVPKVRCSTTIADKAQTEYAGVRVCVCSHVYVHTQVRSLAAATILAMLEGPASKGYLVLADAPCVCVCVRVCVGP